MKVYRDLDEIPIYNFFKVMYNFEKNMNYLYKKNKHNKDLSKEELFNTFEDLQQKYLKLTFSKSDLQDEKLKAKVTYLTGIQEIANLVLNCYLETHYEDVFLILNEFKMFKLKQPITSEDIKNIKKQLIFIENTINLNLAKFKLKHKNGQKNSEELEHNLQKDLDKQALSLETYLELGYKIDVKKTSVLRWVNLVNLSNEKSERIKQL